MAAKLNCMVRPLREFQLHMTRLPAGGRQFITSRHRWNPFAFNIEDGFPCRFQGEAIQSPQETEESDAQGDSGDEDPDFEVVGMSQMLHHARRHKGNLAG